eukprot:6197720-Pleurochrysis_carterae.AAC.5
MSYAWELISDYSDLMRARIQRRQGDLIRQRFHKGGEQKATARCSRSSEGQSSRRCKTVRAGELARPGVRLAVLLFGACQLRAKHLAGSWQPGSVVDEQQAIGNLRAAWVLRCSVCDPPLSLGPGDPARSLWSAPRDRAAQNVRAARAACQGQPLKPRSCKGCWQARHVQLANAQIVSRPQYVSCLAQQSGKTGRASSFAQLRSRMDDLRISRQLGTNAS